LKLLIKHATVHDPRNGIDGEVRDLYINEGRLTDPFPNPEEIIEAKGLLALPGAIEATGILTPFGLQIYAYQAGIPSDPLSLSTRYALMGYTHLHESYMFPTTALETHAFLNALPYQDGSASLCLTLRDFGTLIGSNSPPEWTVRFLDTCLSRFRALNIRLPETSAHFRESTLSRFNLQASRVLAYLAELPLRAPFIVETTSRLLDEDLPAGPHLFYSHLGRAIDGEYAYKQAATHLASKGIRGDMGLAPGTVAFHQLRLEQIMGETEQLSAHIGLHAPLSYTEGTLPAVQSTLAATLATHPDFRKALAFSALCLGFQAGEYYPLLFRKLFETDPSYRVNDFVVQTRVLPAALLGLEDKGHLGRGAIGDIALYKPEKGLSPGETLSRCHTLIKGGKCVLVEGRFVEAASSLTGIYYRVHTPSERDFAMFAGYFKSYPRLEHLEVPEALGNWKPVPATQNSREQ